MDGTCISFCVFLYYCPINSHVIGTRRMLGNIIMSVWKLVWRCEAHWTVTFVNVIVRLLEVGCAALVSGKPPYSACLASKLTHVFVEKACEKDVQALQSAGVHCLSPDYIPEFILQVRF